MYSEFMPRGKECKLKNPTAYSWRCNECQKIYGRRATLRRHIFGIHKAEYAGLDPVTRVGYAIDKPMAEEEFSGPSWEKYWEEKKDA